MRTLHCVRKPCYRSLSFLSPFALYIYLKKRTFPRFYYFFSSLKSFAQLQIVVQKWRKMFSAINALANRHRRFGCPGYYGESWGGCACSTSVSAVFRQTVFNFLGLLTSCNINLFVSSFSTSFALQCKPLNIDWLEEEQLCPSCCLPEVPSVTGEWGRMT